MNQVQDRYSFFITFCVLMLCLCVSVDASAQKIPLNDFVRHSDYLDIKISPDGKHLATRIRQDGSVLMVTLRISDGEVIGGVRPGERNEVSSVAWVNNTRLIYTFAEKSYSNDAASNTGELFAVDLDSEKNKMLAGFRATDEQKSRRIKSKESDYSTHALLNVLPHDDKNVLIVEYPWTLSGNFYYDRRETYPIVSKLNVYTGRKTQKETIPFDGAKIYANDKGEVNFITWSEDSLSRKAAYRTSKAEEWQDVTSSLNTPLGSLSPVSINNNGSAIYLTGRGGDSEMLKLYALDLASKEITKVFNNDFELDFWKNDLNGDPVIGTSYPSRHEYHYSLLKTESLLIKHHKKLKNAFGGQEIQIQTYSEDGKLMVLYVSSDVNPGEYYLYHTETKKADFLWANYSWIDPRTLTPMVAIAFSARDGQTLKGYITVPKPKLNRKALVVVPHGGPHGVRDYPNYDSEVQLLANRGFTVLQINFRGSGGYGKVFETQGYRNWGNVMVDDVIDATRWAIEQGYAAEENVCIYGASYGGYSAMMSVVKAPKLYRCAVGYVGVYDLEAMKVKGDIPIGFRGRSYLDEVLGSDAGDLKEQSPLTHASLIDAKVLLIHGDNDKRVPSYHAKKMRSALKKANNPAEWLYLGDAGHGAFSEKNKTKVYEKLLTFLNDNIGGDN